MNCTEAQEKLQEGFDCALSSAEKQALGLHLAGCHTCRELAEAGYEIDRNLTVEFREQHLTPGFRTAVLRKVREDSREVWPTWLPDVAYFTGAVTALVLCVLLLPLPAYVVLAGGAVSVLAAYVVETALISALEELQEPS